MGILLSISIGNAWFCFNAPENHGSTEVECPQRDIEKMSSNFGVLWQHIEVWSEKIAIGSSIKVIGYARRMSWRLRYR